MAAMTPARPLSVEVAISVSWWSSERDMRQ